MEEGGSSKAEPLRPTGKFWVWVRESMPVLRWHGEGVGGGQSVGDALKLLSFPRQHSCKNENKP